MGGELICQATDFAPAHRIWLAGERKRAHSRVTDAPCNKVAIDDRIDLIGAGRRLIDALGIERHHFAGFAEPIEEKLYGSFRQTARAGNLSDIEYAGGGQRCINAGSMLRHKGLIALTDRIEIGQQTIEQNSVGTRA